MHTHDNRHRKYIRMSNCNKIGLLLGGFFLLLALAVYALQ
jgi:hypothetical protein